ncbi:RDD family protein [Actinotalea sp.]|uniref:RDD family protein n=1 Tax=Actinotalea sp. TaxID=1872145 RepID=UPI0035625301
MGVPGSVPATVRRRLVTLLIDGVAALVLGGGLLVGGLAGQWRPDGTLGPPTAVTLVGAVVLLLFAITQWALLGTTGRTVGGLLTSQRVVDQDSAGPIGLRRALLRCLVVLLSCVVPVLGPVLLVSSSAWDPRRRRRAWHDRIAGTVVLDLVVGLDPRTARSGAVAATTAGLLTTPEERRLLRPARAALPGRAAEPAGQPAPSPAQPGERTPPLPAAFCLTFRVPVRAGTTEYPEFPTSFMLFLTT